jgi:methionyl-tRNA formyltransferase
MATNELILKHAPKIFTETSKIDWNKSTEEVFNLIRGLSPYPGAFSHIDNKLVKIFKAEKEFGNSPLPGTVITDKKTYLKFGCRDGYINVEELQLEGKKRMSVKEFLKGYR